MRFDGPGTFGPLWSARPVQSDSIFDVQDDDTDMTPARPSAPSAGQLKFVTDLRAQYDEAKAECARFSGTTFVPTNWGPLPTDRDAASEAITKGKAAVAAMRAARDEALDGGGFYTDGRTYWLVQVGQESGRPYAKVWDEADEAFHFDRQAMRDVFARGRRATLDEAQAFGVRFGICGECGRTLTNPESIERGIGPICAGKY